MKNLLWLDDLRNPFLNEEGKVPEDEYGGYYNINWVLNYEQFVKWIERFGLPDAISFDHDLAEEHYTPEYFWDNYEESKKFQEWKKQSYKEKTGLECVAWLVEYCKTNQVKLPKCYIHSANPIGADNIRDCIKNYAKYVDELTSQYVLLEAKCLSTYNTHKELPKKQFSEQIKWNKYSGILFKMYDKRDYSENIWNI